MGKLSRIQEYPHPRGFTGFEEVNNWAKKLIMSLEEDAALRLEEMAPANINSYNVILGVGAGENNSVNVDSTEGIYNAFIGHNAGYTNSTGYKNVALGYQALYSITTGYENVGIGNQALYALTTGAFNIAIGSAAADAQTTGGQNIAVGRNALTSNTKGQANVAIGNAALEDFNNTAGDVTANVAVGDGALGNATTGIRNIAVGQGALASGVMTGDYNCALGRTALTNVTSGDNNVAVGAGTGSTLTTGSGNVFIGYLAGESEAGSNKLYIENSNSATPLIYGQFDTHLICINDNANANMTAGLTINQGVNDDEILAFKSSDVGHGVTDRAETDTYGLIKKSSAGSGGVLLWGFSEATIANQFIGTATNDNTSKDATALAPTDLYSCKKSGTNITAVGADGNLLVVRNNGDTRFIVDEDGDILYDGGASSYQDHDDIALLGELEEILSDKISKLEMKNKDVYKKHKIVNVSEGKNEKDEPFFSRFVSTKKKNMLLYGAIRQLAERVKALEEKL